MEEIRVRFVCCEAATLKSLRFYVTLTRARVRVRISIICGHLACSRVHSPLLSNDCYHRETVAFIFSYLALPRSAMNGAHVYLRFVIASIANRH